MATEKEDVELIAELVGTTNAHMKKIDQEIVSTSSNLKRSADLWNPHEIVKEHIKQGGGADVPGASQPPPPSDIPPAGVHPAVQAPPPPPSQVYAQPVAASQPVVQVVTREFEERLEEVEGKLDIILNYIKKSEKLDEKISSFVDRGLKNKVKQITLKLDDTKD